MPMLLKGYIFFGTNEHKKYIKRGQREQARDRKPTSGKGLGRGQPETGLLLQGVGGGGGYVHI